jgi:hypothetical protein
MEGLIFIVFMAVVYFLPTIGAIGAKKRNTSAIFVLNLFLGWTFLGWIIALVWAACKDAEVK